jgi:hypothetical protein
MTTHPTTEDVKKAFNKVVDLVNVDGDMNMPLLQAVKDIAEKFNVLHTIVGMVDIKLIRRLSINPKNLESIKIKYKDYIRQSNIKYSYFFDFESRCILPHYPTDNEQLTRADKLALHLFNVLVKYSEQFKKNPSMDFYNTLIGKFNISANFINQFFRYNELEQPIVDVIPNPMGKERKPSEIWKIGLLTDSMYNTDLDDSELVLLKGWKYDLVKSVQMFDIEWVKHNRTDIYNMMLNFHRTYRVLIHDKHYLVKSNLWDAAKVMLMFFRNKEYGGIVTRKNYANYIRIFKEYSQFGKKKASGFDSRIRVGDVCVPCPCLEDGYESCNHLFKLSDESTYNSFIKAFDGYEHQVDLNDFGDQIANPVDVMMSYISARIDPSQCVNIRLKTTCPKCQYENTVENTEAILNSTGENPIIKHPSDVVCGNIKCKHHYCTDCKESHPGVICRGFKEEPDCDPNIELCPSCGHTTNRVDGCTCITCEIPSCGKTWCWSCRCIRYPEQDPGDIDQSLVHYCMTKNRYRSNINWLMNPDFIPYEDHAPVGQQGWDFIPA